jgi:WD40 repeat protein
LKKVDVDFQPAAMAVQGNKLFVVGKGTATIHVVDASTGKSVKEIKAPTRDPIQKLACNPGKGLLYAATDALDVFSVAPETGKATRTRASGQEIVVDPSSGDFVYTSVYNSTRNKILVQELPGKRFTLRLIKGQTTNLLLKYRVAGADLKLVAANRNAGSGGPWFSVSRDGKRIAMSGPYRGPSVRGLNFNITVFETRDLTTPAGTLDHTFFPRAIAFHPQIDLVATIQDSNPKKAFVFNAKSNARKQTVSLPNLSSFPFKLVFGGEGSKLISAVGMLKTGRQDAAVAITLHDLTLTDDQKDQLKKSLTE